MKKLILFPLLAFLTFSQSLLADPVRILCQFTEFDTPGIPSGGYLDITLDPASNSASIIDLTGVSHAATLEVFPNSYEFGYSRTEIGLNSSEPIQVSVAYTLDRTNLSLKLEIRVSMSGMPPQSSESGGKCEVAELKENLI